MTDLLNQTAKLDKAFDKYPPAVIDGKGPKAEGNTNRGKRNNRQ